MPLFAIAGGLIGGLAATSIGATFLTGWAIGSLIGQLFAPGTDQTISGPRLENTGPSASNIIGNPIQIPYGTVRMPGSIIWSDNITEVENEDKQKSGGSIGGGSSTTTITYEYFLDFAVAICEGPIIGIKKIWANNKVIYDQDGAVESEPWLRYDIYTGTEDQVPDITMSNKLGYANTPAYRGLAYVVFKQFALQEYGNRAPTQIEFEVVAAGNAAGNVDILKEADEYLWSSYSTSPWIGSIPFTNNIITSWAWSREGYGNVIDISAPKAGYQFYVAGAEVSSRSTYQTNLTATGYRLAAQSIIGFNRNDQIVTRYNSSDGDYTSPIENDWMAIYEANGDLVTYRYLGKHNQGSFLFYNFMGYVLDNYFVQLTLEAAYHRWRFAGADTIDPLIWGVWNVESTVGVSIGFDGLNTDYNMHNLKGASVPGSYALGPNITPLGSNRDVATWICQKDHAVDKDTDWLIYSFELYDFYHEYNTTGDPTSGIKNDHLVLSEYMYLNTTDVTLSTSCGVAFSPVSIWSSVFAIVESSGGDWVFIKYQAADTNYYVMAAFKPSNDTVPSKWVTSYPTTVGIGTLGSVGPATNNLDPGYFEKETNTYFIMPLASQLIQFNMSTEEWTLRNTVDVNVGNPAIVGIGNDRYMVAGSTPGTSKTKVSLLDMHKVNAGSTTLSAVISDICDRSKFDPANLDTSLCTGITVQGFSIRDRSPARESIEEVSLPFFVDPVVSDWKLKFIPRGSDIESIIEYNDLGCVEGDNYEEPYALTFPEENSLPKEIDFRYLGKNNNYLTSHQRVSRSSMATNTEDKKTISTFVVMLDEQAKLASQRFLTNAWINSKRISIKVPKKYSYLEPTDIIQVVTKSGILVNARIVEIFNTFNTLEINAELETYDAYDDVDYTEFTAGFDSSDLQKIPLIGTMLLASVDSLPLFDLYTIPNTRSTEAYIYLGGSSYFSQWPGGTVYSSTDNVNYVAGSKLNNPCFTGNIVNSTDLSIQPQNHRVIDKNTSITIDFSRDPELITVTKETLLKGGVNLLHIDNPAGGEIIAAATVSNTDNRYTFTDILRGRYHSYKNISSNPVANASIGTLVTLIDTTNIKQEAMTYGIYDNTYYYKAVTTGANINDVQAKSKTYKGRYNDSPPVAHLEVNPVSTDLVATWVPTSSNNATYPLWEPSIDTSLYRVEIYNINDTLIRTVDDINDTTYTYTAANMTTDSVSITDSLTFRVYRKSSMKGYDTYYAEYNSNTGLKNLLTEVVTPQLLYLFDNIETNETTLVDEMQSATNPNLVLNTGTMSNYSRYPSELEEKRRSASLRMEGQRHPYFKTSGTTAGSSVRNFSFMLVFKVTKAPAGADNVKILTRDGTSTWGIHSYSISADSSTNSVSFSGDLEGTGTIGTLGESICVIVTTDDESLANSHNELIYVNGVYVDGGYSNSFVSNWIGEFEFGDTDGLMDNNTDIVIETFAYWNSKLSATQVADVYRGYLGAKK